MIVTWGFKHKRPVALSAECFVCNGLTARSILPIVAGVVGVLQALLDHVRVAPFGCGFMPRNSRPTLVSFPRDCLYRKSSIFFKQFHSSLFNLVVRIDVVNN